MVESLPPRKSIAATSGWHNDARFEKDDIKEEYKTNEYISEGPSHAALSVQGDHPLYNGRYEDVRMWLYRTAATHGRQDDVALKDAGRVERG